MEEFRQLLHSPATQEFPAEALVDNWRPVQPLHQRRVQRSQRFLLAHHHGLHHGWGVAAPMPAMCAAAMHIHSEAAAA